MTVAVAPLTDRDVSAVTAGPKVGIVVVNFRTPTVTIAAIRSLQQLSYPNAEIVLVDNDSQDGSVEQFRSAFESQVGPAPRSQVGPASRRSGTGQRPMPPWDEGMTGETPVLLPVRVLSATENGGYTAGNNLGIASAIEEGADFVLIVNPDVVVIEPTFVNRLVQVMLDQPDLGAVGPRVFLRTVGNVQNTVLRFPWVWRRISDWLKARFGGHRPLRSGNEPVVAEVLNGVCVLLRSACLKEVGLFDERTFAYIEDIDWAFRAQKTGWQRMYWPTNSIVHLQKEAGYDRAGGVDFLLKRNTLYFLLKNHRRLQAVLYTISIVMLGMLRQIGLIGRWSAFGQNWRWLRRLVRSYYGLWLGRWEQNMGRPN